MSHDPRSLRGRLAERLPVIALVIVVFAIANAAASSLELSIAPVPQMGTVTPADPCQTGELAVGYQVTMDRTAATAMTVTGVSEPCGGISQLTLTLQPESAYFDGAVNYAAPVAIPEGVTPADAFLFPFASAVPLNEFSTGTVTVIVEATTGVSVVTP